jgi:SulP family sulfate permease
VVNIKAGGSGRASGAIHSLFLLTLLLGAAPLASQIPLAVLAGILVKVGLDILDYRLLKRLRHSPRPDIMVMGVVFGLTVFVDLIAAVGVGVVLSMGLIIHRLIALSSFNVWAEENNTDSENPNGLKNHTRVLEIRGAFFFGSASQLIDRVDQLLGTQTVIIQCQRVPFMDLSAIFTLEEMVESLQSQSIRVMVVVSPKIKQQLLDLNAPSLPPDIIYDKLEDAKEASKNAIQ